MAIELLTIIVRIIIEYVTVLDFLELKVASDSRKMTVKILQSLEFPRQ